MSYINIPTSQLTNEELCRLPVNELVQQLRKSDGEKSKAMRNNEQMMKEINQRMQDHLVEIRSLKDVISRQQEDNQQLQDLCCFLDDERQKGRKLSKEWQKFGRYTSGVMRGEVGVYQDKLKELEKRQEEMMAENLELKRLCVYLEEERTELCKETSATRDQGDGSSNSSSTSTDKLDVPTVHTTQQPVTLRNRPPSDGSKYSNSEETVQYVRQLEERIQQLEQEKKLTAQSNDNNDSSHSSHSNYSNHGNPSNYRNDSGVRSRSRVMSPSRADTHRFFDSPDDAVLSRNTPVKQRPQSWSRSQSVERPPSWNRSPSPNPGSRSPTKPEAVVHAMKVLDIHEQLERPHRDHYEQDDMDDMQKALVREMCNVVWRKLGDDVPGLKTQV